MYGTHSNNFSLRKALRLIWANSKYTIGYLLRLAYISTANFLERISLFSTTIRYVRPDEFEYEPLSTQEWRFRKHLRRDTVNVLIAAYLLAIIILLIGFALINCL